MALPLCGETPIYSSGSELLKIMFVRKIVRPLVTDVKILPDSTNITTGVGEKHACRYGVYKDLLVAGCCYKVMPIGQL